MDPERDISWLVKSGRNNSSLSKSFKLSTLRFKYSWYPQWSNSWKFQLTGTLFGR